MQDPRHLFTALAKRASRASGQPLTFALAVAVVVVWAATGSLFGYSDTWQLVINTSTTIVTFLMVFLIQNTQNRDSAAVQIKLDELIRTVEGAHNALLDLEELEDKDIDQMRRDYEHLARVARQELRRGIADTSVSEVESQPSTPTEQRANRKT